MGREASAQCSWQGQSGQAKVVLESREIILRGEVKARIARGAVRGFAVEGDALVIDTAQGALTAELGAKEAGKWLAALSKPQPTLAGKLGIGHASKALVLGDHDDADLAEALEGHTAGRAEVAAVVVAIIGGTADLDKAIAAAGDKHIWCVYPKGKAVAFGDMAIRTHLRERGFMDNKTCAVSERLTATRYRKR